MAHLEAGLGSPGDIAATFVIPEKMRLLSGDSTSIITIVKLILDAKICRITIPKREAKILRSVSFFSNIPSFLFLTSNNRFF